MSKYLDETGLTYFYSKINDKINNRTSCEEVTCSVSTVDIFIGETYQIPEPVVTPSDTTDLIKYYSEDPLVCNVNNSGVITGVSLGVTTIKIKCGTKYHLIRVNVAMYLPKNVGLLGFMSNISSSNVLNIYVGDSNDKYYTIPYINHEIQPGYSVHIRTKNQYYSIYKCYVVENDYSLSIASSGSYTFNNTTLVSNLGTAYSVSSKDYTNDTQDPVCLIISFGFYVDETTERTDANAAITQQQLEAFANRDDILIWISPTSSVTPSVSSDGKIDVIEQASKEAVETLICKTVNVTGTTPVITAEKNTRYICGEVSTLSFTPPSEGIANVVFSSGSTETVLTLPNTVKMPSWFQIETNTTYEISIADGIYGVVTSWPA